MPPDTRFLGLPADATEATAFVDTTDLASADVASSFHRRKINTSPLSVDEPAILKKLLTTPPVKAINLHFPLGMEVTARNRTGVTIKDALDAIYKPYKKRVSLSGLLYHIAPSSFCRRATKDTLLVESLCPLRADADSYRRTTNWTSRTWPASNGTRRSPGRVWWCTCLRTRAPRTRPRRRRRAATSNEAVAPTRPPMSYPICPPSSALPTSTPHLPSFGRRRH
jgi:hypothetical protein